MYSNAIWKDQLEDRSPTTDMFSMVVSLASSTLAQGLSLSRLPSANQLHARRSHTGILKQPNGQTIIALPDSDRSDESPAWRGVGSRSDWWNETGTPGKDEGMTGGESETGDEQYGRGRDSGPDARPRFGRRLGLTAGTNLSFRRRRRRRAGR